MTDGSGQKAPTAAAPGPAGSGLAFRPVGAGSEALGPAAPAAFAALVRDSRQPMLLVQRESGAAFFAGLYNDAFAQAIDIQAGLALQAALLPSVVRVFSGDAVRLNEIPLPGRAGPEPTLIRAALSLTPVRDAAGAIIGAVGAVEPLPAPPLQDGERELLETIIDSIPVMITLYDPDVNVLRLNRAFQRLTGWTTADAVRRPIMEVCYPDPSYREEVRRFMAEGAGWKDICMRTRSGAMLETSWANVRLGDGRQIGIGLDISERRRAEEGLSRSERRLRLALDAAQMGAWEVREGSDHGYIDAGMAALFGLAEGTERMSLDFFYTVTHPDDRALVAERVKRAWDTGSDFSAEFRVLVDGRERWLVGRGRVVSEPGGRHLFGVNYDITPVKQAEESVRRSEEMRRLALEGAAFGTWDTDLVSGATTWDARTREIFGIDPDEPATLQRGMALIHPDDRDAAESSFQAAVAADSNGRYAMEKRIVRPGGGLRWVAANGRVLFSPENGRPVRMVGVIRDITRRKRADVALRASEERLRVAVASLPIVVWQQDRDLRYTWVQNPRLGLDESLVGQTDEEILPPSEAAKVVPLKQKVLESGEGLRTEVELTVGEQSEIYEFALEPIRDPQGSVTGVTGAAHEVTDLRRTARSLATSEARFRTMTEAMPQMVWSTRPDGYHDFFNARWYEFTGAPAGATDGLGWCNLFHPDDQGQMWEKWTRCLETGEPYESRYRLRHHSGEYRWVLGRAAPLHDETGAVVRWMGTCTDIDAIQKAEEHRKLLIDELNHRVKNTLAIVQGIAQQTFRHDAASKTAQLAFEGRLAALASAHNLLTREHWERASLHSLAAETLQARGANRGRVHLAGPPVVLQPKQAVTVAMALHELCTNAVKYGALSNEAGTVSLEWDVAAGAEPLLTLLWREVGGPAVTPPAKRGFGLRLIERALAYELDGDVSLCFRPQGVSCEIKAVLNTTTGEKAS
ncbi:MAG: PAS domain S-box protein [Alphaproteobacteria bacterium]|nr:PAS domain S-box protein [Alphaproteobacteria bacterium]